MKLEKIESSFKNTTKFRLQQTVYSIDACQNSYHGSFPTGCVHTELFWIRCCNSSKPKAIYRRVKGCTANMFPSSRLSQLCQE